MPQELMTSVAAIRAYLFGCRHQAIFTIVSKKTGFRSTYRVRRNPDKRDFFFVDLLTGEENESDYTFIGTIRRESAEPIGWSFRFSLKAALHRGIREQDSGVIALDYFVARLNYSRDLDPSKLEFWHSGTCSRCGRTLTVPASLTIGMGPKCAAKAREMVR